MSTTTTTTTSSTTTTTTTTGPYLTVGTYKEVDAIYTPSVNYAVATFKDTRPPTIVVPGEGGNYEKTGIVTRQHPPIVHVKTGDIMFNPYKDEWTFGIVFDPYAIDCGFIIEDFDYTISIWNQYKTQSVTISSIVITSPDGLILDKSAPIVIPPYSEEFVTLTVYLDGPPFQSSIITFTIDGVDYRTTVTGLRVLAFPSSINWDSGYHLDYTYKTVFQSNKKRYEQRRPLSTLPRRNTSFEIFEEGDNLMYIRNLLQYGHDKFFLVPVYSEPMMTDRVAAIYTNDYVVIDDRFDLTYYYNLQNYSDYVIIVDHNTLVAEVKEVDSLVDQTITFTSAVAENFDVATTVLYPAILSIIENVRFTTETDNLSILKVKFDEWVKSDR